ncbi:MAG TPA: hypothetical protein PK264_19475, partial [Hyphomicrobiaceae bacterium]|nr:hypothetical protein [Hyphomicrobiaceae bacterium]
MRSDPYFLYGASNLGSFLALLGYPLVLEPYLGLKSMSRWWTIGFVALIAAIALSLWYVRSSEAPRAAGSGKPSDVDADTAAPTWGQRLGWIGLAFVPSALLTAFTTHVSTDVASAPLIWVVPLAFYLLTFVLVFRDRPIILVPAIIMAALLAHNLLPATVYRLSYTYRYAMSDSVHIYSVLAVALALAVAYLSAGYPRRLGMVLGSIIAATGAFAVIHLIGGAGQEHHAAFIAIVAGLLFAAWHGGLLERKLFEILAGVVGATAIVMFGLPLLYKYFVGGEMQAMSRIVLALMAGATALAAIMQRAGDEHAADRTWWMGLIHLVSVVATLFFLAPTGGPGWWTLIVLGSIVFFSSTMVAHRTLFELRPAAKHLTSFYLLMSLGGGLGGLFTALIAPQIFKEVYEYPLLLALSMFCRPGVSLAPLGSFVAWIGHKGGILRNSSEPEFSEAKANELMVQWLLLAGGLLVLFWVPWILQRNPVVYQVLDQYLELESVLGLLSVLALGGAVFVWLQKPQFRQLAVAVGIVAGVFLISAWLRNPFRQWDTLGAISGAFALVLFLCWKFPTRQAIMALLMGVAVVWHYSGVKQDGVATRSFFGVYRVHVARDGRAGEANRFMVLQHGTTLHGAQRRARPVRCRSGKFRAVP